ncbi:fungal-specific transcription factor domain-domain-containing protein [Clohesyomyces aquaticus]|uniref:Fungal-specific transcription factor domain-domain-containing protein n=1 Tax=Clohesyomyces aquaticus TaxID=1231657 RepID=A0A1Y2ABJ8_9PLEO|nr:fungal-specific transcription factor domain-domain-containing protein [Clohesyomyces aquaticus]
MSSRRPDPAYAEFNGHALRAAHARATEQNQDLVKLLKSLQKGVGETDKKRIEELLLGVSDDIADAASSVTKSPAKTRSPDFQDRGEANTGAEVGSNDDMDLLDEDLLSSEQSRATGFVGKNSEIQWFRRLHHEVARPDEAGGRYEGPYGPPGDNPEAASQRLEAMRRRQAKDPGPPSHLSNFSFYLDDEKLETVAGVDPYALPPLVVAERLFNCYMDSIQNSFPILAERIFRNQFHQYYASWQAILNLVLAIGAVYSHLTEAYWRSDERDHVIYHSRACALGLRDFSWISNPDLSQMQITGLQALYYLVIGHINRAWVIVGISVRFAYALGLHVRNEDRSASAVRKETLVRMWWGLYSLERVLSAVSGRPSVVHEIYCSVPLPLPLSTEEMDEDTIASRTRRSAFDETSSFRSESGAGSSLKGSINSPTWPSSKEPTNSGSYLLSWTRLSMITHKSVTQLYSARTVSKSWEDIQLSIVALTAELEAWAASLPSDLDFTAPNRGQPFQRERDILEMNYYGTRILITRSCVCRLDRRIQNQSQGSSAFNHRTGRACVAAAISVAGLLPNQVEPARIYQLGPWWSIIHSLMQALAILLLELSYEVAVEVGDNNPKPQDRQDIATSLRKLMDWLKAMRSSNKMAERAYSVALGLLEKVVDKVKPELSDQFADLLQLGQSSSPEPTFYHDESSKVLYHDDYGSTFSAGQTQLVNDYPLALNPYEYELANPSALYEGETSFPEIGEVGEPSHSSPPNMGAQYNILTHLFTTTHDEQNPFTYTSPFERGRDSMVRGGSVREDDDVYGVIDRRFGAVVVVLVGGYLLPAQRPALIIFCVEFMDSPPYPCGR